MTHGDHVILDLQDLVNTQQLIMAPKLKTIDKFYLAKRQRNVITLHEEIKLFDASARSESAASVGRHHWINESTVYKCKF